MKNVSLTEKAKAMNIERFNIKGLRWFQKTYGNTYHTTYISALINGVWQDIGSTAMEYGYSDQYITTGCQWLVDNGFVQAESGYDVQGYQERAVLNIDCYAQDVQHKKDI